MQELRGGVVIRTHRRKVKHKSHQMIGNRRVISFTPETEFFAKGCYGIEGAREIPTLAPTDANDFLTRLFDEARANIEADNEAFAPMREQYDAAMSAVSEILSTITDADTAMQAASAISSLNHALTSLKEARALLKEKTDSLGLKYSRESGGYVKAEA